MIPNHLCARFTIFRTAEKNIVELSSRKLSLFSSERVTQRRKMDPREKNNV